MRKFLILGGHLHMQWKIINTKHNEVRIPLFKPDVSYQVQDTEGRESTTIEGPDESYQVYRRVRLELRDVDGTPGFECLLLKTLSVQSGLEMLIGELSAPKMRLLG